MEYFVLSSILMIFISFLGHVFYRTINGTHVVYSIDERIVTAVAHCQPVATEKYDVYETKPKLM